MPGNQRVYYNPFSSGARPVAQIREIDRSTDRAIILAVGQPIHRPIELLERNPETGGHRAFTFDRFAACNSVQGVTAVVVTLGVLATKDLQLAGSLYDSSSNPLSPPVNSF